MQVFSRWPGWAKIAVFFVVFSFLGGMVLGACSPTISGTVTGQHIDFAEGSSQARFMGLVWYSAIATIGGIGGAVVAWRCAPYHRGLRTELLATLWALIAGVGLFYWARMTAIFLYPLPAADSLSSGDVVEWVPVSFSVAALPFMPFFTALVYWALLVVHPEVDDD